jgi:hypothetical protein
MHSKLGKAVTDRRCKQIPSPIARCNDVKTGQADGENKKPPTRITVAVESKILASREEAAPMLSISERALGYLISTRRLPTRRIGGRVLIPISELRKYAWTDHPERIVA